jgi:hypothetical protein
MVTTVVDKLMKLFFEAIQALIETPLNLDTYPNSHEQSIKYNYIKLKIITLLM